jgi:hypothetical protein
MVLFTVETQDSILSKSGPGTKDPYLVVCTNKIDDDLLNMIDIRTTKNIVFQIPTGQPHNMRDITFDFQVSDFAWSIFARDIQRIEFRGVFTNNQFTAKHLQCMRSIQGLYIGATEYPLFKGEELSDIPMIKYVALNGYGLVKKSPTLDAWREKLKEHGCECVHYI